MEDPANVSAPAPTETVAATAEATKAPDAADAAPLQTTAQADQEQQPRETESLVQNLDSLQLKDKAESKSQRSLQQLQPQQTPINRVRQDEDKELASAKQWMMEKKGKEGKSLYDHLVKVVSRLVDEKPQNALDILEQVSAQLKKESINPESYKGAQSLANAKQLDALVASAKVRAKVLTQEEEDEAAQGGEIPDIMDLANLFEWAGVSLGSEETFLLSLSVRTLTKQASLRSVRLFGKVLGTQKDYVIVESELENPDEDWEDPFTKQAESEQEAPAASEEEAKEPELDENGNPKIPEELQGIPPKPKAKRQAKYAPETQSGVNRYVYWACNQVGGEWVRLPDVTPQQIQISRRLRKLCTGDLTQKLETYPAFPGVEAHYLRCMIARIAASTVVSPAGYYTAEEENAGDDNGNAAPTIIINPEYDGLPSSSLLDLSNWVHHTPYILPQGRTTFVDPFARDEDEEEEEQEEEMDGGSENGERVQEEHPESTPEESKPVLSQLSEDNSLSTNVPAWSAHLGSTLSPSKYSPVFLRSLLWPGAVTIAYNDKFANLYIGNGLKALPVETAVGETILPGFYQPPRVAPIQSEYAGDELTEGVDPTVEEEKAFEEMMKKSKEGEAGEEAVEEGENEEEAAEEEEEQ